CNNLGQPRPVARVHLVQRQALPPSAAAPTKSSVSLLINPGHDHPAHKEVLREEEQQHRNNERHQGCCLDEVRLLVIDEVKLLDTDGNRHKVTFTEQVNEGFKVIV